MLRLHPHRHSLLMAQLTLELSHSMKQLVTRHIQIWLDQLSNYRYRIIHHDHNSTHISTIRHGTIAIDTYEYVCFCLAPIYELPKFDTKSGRAPHIGTGHCVWLDLFLYLFIFILQQKKFGICVLVSEPTVAWLGIDFGLPPPWLHQYYSYTEWSINPSAPIEIYIQRNVVYRLILILHLKSWLFCSDN